MKKVLGTFLVLMAVMSIAVFAEPPTYTPATDGTYDISYTGTSGNYYALLVVKDVYEADETPVISQDTVLYIDQATADSSGAVRFKGWIPKNDEPATVYLGGTGLDKPELLGYLGSNTFIVSGAVTTDSNTSYEATVTLTDAESNVFTAVSVNGTYSIEVPEGNYTFNVNVKNHLSYTDAGFAVNADVAGKDVAVRGGDVDASGMVEFNDLAEILKGYNTVSDFDIDGAGTVNFDDLAIVLRNYGNVAVSE